ncbi:Holliday junction branch migration protein RuvA [Clostridium fallax]|uniref:Holliday junction branch migration complex subunit RuvA n=1 Tax=Clostridium fallax TaxID=1533 RepID=A0A1M4UAU9_9CLOT|nr:Holliday junction branch migration protein RuvA [Clostridium fallax]SHE54001.1 Holliday junction DNA helicase subunit RuvA [Clostridium fallax]SQB06171.1 Holliday junction DNA helicase RuvA [Clostridium fallax]
MYEYIIGKYKGLNKDYVIIENNGLGYKIFTSGSTIAKMPKINEEVTLYLEQIVRQDFIGLYGFLTKEELEMFKKLLTINGVGSKAALSLLSISNVNNLKYAILIGDEKHIVRAPGIGKKTAQRIILELKDKFKEDEILEEHSIDSGEESDKFNIIKEAKSALVALGYTEKEAEKSLKSIDKNDSLENIIKKSLIQLMG